MKESGSLDQATGKDAMRMLGNTVDEYWKGFGLMFHLAERKKDIEP